jgi:hypothetical protein
VPKRYDPSQPRDPGGEGGGQWVKAADFDLAADTEAAELKAYMTMVAAAKAGSRDNNLTYKSIEEFVLKNGRAFSSPVAGLPKGFKGMKMGFCFMNAYQLADMRPDLTYVEGFASYRGVPMAHAWVVDKQNRVIDPTWFTDKKGTPNHWTTKSDHHRYFGVKFKIDDVRKTIFARGKYGVLHNPEQGFPLLRGER